MHLHPPAIIPGMVVLQYLGEDSPESGEKKGHYVNVFPVDARELVGTGKYALVDNGASEAARLNSGPLRQRPAAPVPMVPAPPVVDDAVPAPRAAVIAPNAPVAEKAAPVNPARK